MTIPIPAASLVLPEHLSVLEIDQVQKLSQPDSPHVAPSIFNLHARLSNNQDFWQWIILSMIVIIALYLLYRKYKAKLPSCTFLKSPNPCEPPTYSSDTPVHYVASTSTTHLYPNLPNYPSAPQVTEISQNVQTDPEDLNL